MVNELRSPLLALAAKLLKDQMIRSRSDSRVDAILARHGLRATRQRTAVLRLLRKMKTHPTAIELHRLVLRKQPNVSRKTVYEVLDALVSVGLALCVTDGGEPYRYEASMGLHYHARCGACGRLYDLTGNADKEIRARTSLPSGFQVESIQVTIRGLCHRCRSRR